MPIGGGMNEAQCMQARLIIKNEPKYNHLHPKKQQPGGRVKNFSRVAGRRAVASWPRQGKNVPAAATRFETADFPSHPPDCLRPAGAARHWPARPRASPGAIQLAIVPQLCYRESVIKTSLFIFNWIEFGAAQLPGASTPVPHPSAESCERGEAAGAGLFPRMRACCPGRSVSD